MSVSSVQFQLVAQPSPTASVLSTPPISSAKAPQATPRPKRRWPIVVASILLLLTGFVLFINHYNVDKTVTDEDRKYIRLYIPGYPEGYAKTASYNDQIKVIELAQERVGQRTTGWAGIAEGSPREPKTLYESQSGLCYDRSRVLEKILLYLGFETRHLSLFLRESKIHSWETLLFHHVQSHAISEVHTKHGWLMVDSNDLWVSLDAQHQPVSMHQLQSAYLQGKRPTWEIQVPAADERFYNDRCIPIYGLYSRHGRFYPPYTSGIPDYRVRGLMYNLEDE